MPRTWTYVGVVNDAHRYTFTGEDDETGTYDLAQDGTDVTIAVTITARVPLTTTFTDYRAAFDAALGL